MKPLKDESRIRARVFDVIRRIIDIPPSQEKDRRSDFLRPPQISEFKGIDPALLYDLDDEDEGGYFDPSICSPSVVWPIDVSVILQRCGDFGLTVMRHRTVGLREVRGCARRVSPFMLREDVGVEVHRKFVVASGLLTYVGGVWTDANLRAGESASSSEFENGGLAISVALRQRYEWAVNIGFENSPSVRIVTDPTGLKELFRLRDVSDGRDRRDTLMTWVSDHWRKNRADEDIESYVRKHMRGSRRFEWRGMTCEIMPAQFDMEQRERLIVERAAMKRAGTDKRAAS